MAWDDKNYFDSGTGESKPVKLKVLGIEGTPKGCSRRVVLSRDAGYQEWVRDTQDNVFVLWTGARGRRGDRVYDPRTKKWCEAESPFTPVLDEDGYETGETKIKPGIIAFPVDIYEHSGTAWALSGEGGACFSCPYDTPRGAYWLYVDQERWESMVCTPEWKFVDGRPTPELLKRAREIAREEIREMNLCEEGEYYSYTEQIRNTVKAHTEETVNDFLGTSSVSEVAERAFWDDVDSCSGFLTDKPARDVDFPLGCPVVTDKRYMEGDTFEQQCFAFSDDITGKFVRFTRDGYDLVDDPIIASLYVREYLTGNRKHYEDKLGRALTVVDVTERIWSRYPECLAD